MADFTNTRESGLETLIVKWLVEHNGYEEGFNTDYNKEYAIDETRLFRFLQGTQPEQMDKLGVFKSEQKKRQFLNRLYGEIAKRGIIDVLRNGIKVYPVDLIMFYLTPTENNAKARELFEKNIFSVTRQLRYAQDAGKLALDMCIFINGLPVITFELKNQLTKQNVDDAVQQYKDDRDPRESLFTFKRCMVHFAVDDARIKFCTKLAGQDSWFLPFDKGYNDGAGNPPNPGGLMTDYLWKDILTKEKLTLIIENYAQVIVDVDEDTKKKKEKQIFPRYHQLDVVTKLLADVKTNGVGKKYLIQHSAGSGKSNSIAWLAHQLIGLEQDGRPMLDSVIVVTDRRILDKQIRDTIKQFMQVGNTVAWAEHSGDLTKAITDGKRIIVTTIEKFPYIVPQIGAEHKDNHFAIIIDEAHSGQSGRNSAQMNLALSGLASDDEMDNEDKINAMMEGRKLLNNASYFAFTATPKNKTLETFGVPYQDGDDVKHRPFHVYTMKQAIQEGFILDVLQYYTPIDSFYKLMKTVEDDPMFDKKRAQKKLRSFVESDSYTIAKKAAMMVDHFHEQVIAKGKIGGQARAMVVTSSIPRCIEYYYAINKCLADRHSPYKTIIAFSGENKYQGQEPPLTSAGLNGFPDAKIPKEFKKDPYRILIVADMFQTGFDEPLLHTMYVDKKLRDVTAVQTLSRLNRTTFGKNCTFVMDFENTEEDIKGAFLPYYETTTLEGSTDLNRVYDLRNKIRDFMLYNFEDVEAFNKFMATQASKEQDATALGRLAGMFRPVIARYMDLSEEDRYTVRDYVRKFNKAYAFVTQLVRLHDRDLFNEYQYTLHLIRLLPRTNGEDIGNIEDKIKLEYASLTETFRGAIVLDEKPPAFVPGGSTAPKAPNKKKDTLQSIIDKVNERFSGNFTDADRVIIEGIYQMFMRDSEVKKFRKYAKDNSTEMFVRSLFPDKFRDIVTQCFLDNNDSFAKLFNDPDFYQKVQEAMAQELYKTLRKE